jgi:gas vesicle protein
MSAFEGRFGEGATELDALEALHPGELRKIVEREIERYHDADLDDRIEQTVAEVRGEIRELQANIEDEHRDEIEELEADWEEISDEAEALRAEIEEKQEKLQAKIEAWEERAEPTWQAIAESLNEQAPDVDSFEWPEPDEGDEDEDPLYDSRRGYVEQIDRYKEFQGKPTEQRAYASRPERLKKNRRHITDRSQATRGGRKVQP